MHRYSLALLLAVSPFWDSKEPGAWTIEELRQLMSESPWAQQVTSGFSAPSVQVYLASAQVMRLAEQEAQRRFRKRGDPPDLTREEYEAYFRENPGKLIVLAVQAGNAAAFMDDQEMKRLEDGCALKIGRKKHRLAGHFPPTPQDPHLRLVFPREVPAGTKELKFELYVPGLSHPEREAVFALKDLRYKGEVDY